MEKICCECNKNGASYKCPMCKKPYCSMACCKLHKAGNCKPPEPSQSEENNDKNQGTNNTKYEFPTEDTVSKEKLEQLRDSEELKNCLKNPHVRNIMRAILTDSNPTKAIALAMTEPIFVEMADACLKVVEPPDFDKPC